MDRSLSTFLRSLQISASSEEALRLLPSATGLLSNLNNPLNLEILASQVLSAPALWNDSHDLTFSRHIFGSFYTAARSVSQNKQPSVLINGQFPLRRLSTDAWVKAVVKGADEKSPRWRHVLLLGGVLLGVHGDHGAGTISTSLRHKLESALVTATNLAISSESSGDPLVPPSLALVLNHTFDLLSDAERARLQYNELLPMLIETIFTSREGLEHGVFISLIDEDVREIPGRKFQWRPQSPSCNHIRTLLAKPLTSALGPLSRLAAHSLENASNPGLVLETVSRISDFSRVLSTQWRQNKLSEIDASEEAMFLDPETIKTSLPLLWQALRSSLYAAIIVLRSALGRVLNDPMLGIENAAVQIALQSLHSLRNLYFITSRLGQTSTAQYLFVTYTAIDILNVHSKHAEGFLSAIRPVSLGQIPPHPLDRTLDLFFVNTAEHFTLVLSPQTCDDLLLAAAAPYLISGGNNSLLETFEAAHSLTLAVFSAPQNAQLTVRHLPFYIDSLFSVFPKNLSDRQFRFAFKTLIIVLSPPSPLAREQPMLASTLLQMVYDRAWDASNSPLPPISTADASSQKGPLSEQAVLIMALLDSLPHVSPDVLEEWLPLAAVLVHRVDDPKMLKACQERFWDIMSSGEMDVQRATVAVAWWTSRGGREMVLFGDAPVIEDPYVMSGALDNTSKL